MGAIGGGPTVVQQVPSESPAVTPPTPSKAAVMPEPDPGSPASIEARRRELEKAAKRAGRRSTILTNEKNRGLVPAYTNTTLGGAV